MLCRSKLACPNQTAPTTFFACKTATEQARHKSDPPLPVAISLRLVLVPRSACLQEREPALLLPRCPRRCRARARSRAAGAAAAAGRLPSPRPTTAASPSSPPTAASTKSVSTEPENLPPLSSGRVRICGFSWLRPPLPCRRLRDERREVARAHVRGRARGRLRLRRRPAEGEGENWALVARGGVVGIGWGGNVLRMPSFDLVGDGGLLFVSRTS